MEEAAPSVRELEEVFKRIQQHTELMLHAPALMSNPARAAEHLQVIVAAVDAGKKAIRKTRETAEPAPAPLEAPKPIATIATVSLDAVFEKALSSTKAKAGGEGRATGSKVTFVKQFEKGAEVLGDPVRLREMLAHLIRNAMNAIPRRGTVTVGAEQRGGDVIAFVQDDGLGLTEAVRQRLLDPSAVTDHPDGRPSGYGVIHEVVARHRGRLEIESRKGIGTTVRVILPSAKSASAIERRHRILAADDDPMVREVISTYLSEDAYAVELAADGKEAFEKFCAGEFDLVLADLSMPGMQGDELAREMKKRKPKVPVLLLTGFGERLAATGGRPEGVDLVLSKPFTMAGLRDSLAKFL
jgi:CheY-like chemotaxis protein